MDHYEQSGSELIGKLLPGERVLHIGYDTALFEGKVSNFLSVPELEEYARANSHMKFNVAFCLEYINFGSKQVIEEQIAILVKLLRERDARIYWRCNPGVQDYVGEQDIYPWTFEEHQRLAEKFNFEIVEMDWDSRQRIYAQWVSKNKSWNIAGT